MNHCKDCKYWERKEETKYNPNWVGCCTHEKWRDAYYFEKQNYLNRDALYHLIPYEHRAGLYPSEDFGCVHWEKKEI